MSVARTRFASVKYRINPRFSMNMIPWHRQVISLIYGLGVIMIALWALEQGQGPYVVLGVVGMSCLTLMLIFGVEVEAVRIGNIGEIEFTDTSDSGRLELTDTTDDEMTVAEAKEMVRETDDDD